MHAAKKNQLINFGEAIVSAKVVHTHAARLGTTK